MPRLSRADAQQAERRRRRPETLDGAQNNRLAVAGAIMDHNFHYRWVNDDNNRVYNMTQLDDYDPVVVSNPETSEDEKLRRPVGVKPTGEPMYAVLCRKPLQFYEDDQRAKVEANKATQDALLRTPTPAPEDNRSDGQAYIAGQPTVRRSNFTP